MENEKEDFFTSKDLYFATALVTLGFPVKNIDFQIEGERRMIGYFAFENTPEFQEAKEQYWARELVVEPQAFILNMKGLKSQVNNIYKNPHSKF